MLGNKLGNMLGNSPGNMLGITGNKLGRTCEVTGEEYQFKVMILC